MSTVINNLTMRIMAINTYEHAIIKAAVEDIYGAETAYAEALELAQQAVVSAANEFERNVSARIVRQIEVDFAAFCTEHQPYSTILERMGPHGLDRIMAMPDAERETILEMIGMNDRINRIERELAQLQAAYA